MTKASTRPPSRRPSPASGPPLSAGRPSSRLSRLTRPATWTRSHPGAPPVRVQGGRPPGRPGAPGRGLRLATLRQQRRGRRCGLVPSEYSSGEKVQRGSLTHAGNAHLRRQLIESAWAYTTGPSLGPPCAVANRVSRLRLQRVVGLPGRPVPTVPGPRQAQAGARGSHRRHRPPAGRAPLRRDGRVVRMALRSLTRVIGHR